MKVPRATTAAWSHSLAESAVIFIVDHLTQHNASWIGTSFVEWRILNWSLHIPSFASIVVHPSAAAAKTPTQLKLKAAVLLSEHPHHQECALRGGGLPKPSYLFLHDQKCNREDGVIRGTTLLLKMLYRCCDQITFCFHHRHFRSVLNPPSHASEAFRSALRTCRHTICCF